VFFSPLFHEAVAAARHRCPGRAAPAWNCREGQTLPVALPKKWIIWPRSSDGLAQIKEAVECGVFLAQVIFLAGSIGERSNTAAAFRRLKRGAFFRGEPRAPLRSREGVGFNASCAIGLISGPRGLIRPVIAREKEIRP